MRLGKSGLLSVWFALRVYVCVCVCGLQLVLPVGLFYRHRSIPYRFLPGSSGHQPLFCHALPSHFLFSLSATVFWLSVVCWGLCGASEIGPSAASAVSWPTVATFEKKKVGRKIKKEMREWQRMSDCGVEIQSE